MSKKQTILEAFNDGKRDAGDDRLRKALAEVRRLIQQLPSGADFNANPEETSPEDAAAHVGGLIVQEIDKALGAKP